jgi:hypothetical protein
MPTNNSKHLVQAGDKFHRLTVISFSHHDKRWRRHYLVRCDCGKEKTVQGISLRSGNTKSCGCLGKEVTARRRKPDSGGELTAVILGYKIHAKHRDLAWLLSREEVREIIRQPCRYCGIGPTNKKTTKNSRQPFFYSGIDRVDNAIGYEPSNVVPCCALCNRAKGALTAQAFYAWMKRVGEMAAQWGQIPNTSTEKEHLP